MNSKEIHIFLPTYQKGKEKNSPVQTILSKFVIEYNEKTKKWALNITVGTATVTFDLSDILAIIERESKYDQ